MQKKINLTYLYPDICNLHGDRGNVWAFERIAKQLNLDLQVNRVDNLDSIIDFYESDILLISPGELTHLLAILKTLKAQQTNLENYIEEGKYFICLGTTGSIFSKEIIRVDGNKYEGLGIINGTSKELIQPYGDDLLFSCIINKTEHKICGSQIQMIDLELYDNHILGNITYGYGNNNSKTEGYQVKNFIFSNSLGPVFTKNPWLAESILRDIASKKNIQIDTSVSCDFSSEKTSCTEIEKFNLSKATPL